jgi:uncharacterized protein YdeI (YjbR/CyaY-like superfamily)
VKAIYFRTPAAFRRWLARHHASARELWVGFFKKHTLRPSITYAESVAEALCYGWIDGIRKSVDADRYVNRFTPRRAGSNWSEVNIRLAEELIASGRMRPAGLRVFDARRPERSGRYSYEQRRTVRLSPEAEAAFRAQEDAWRGFQAQPAGYRQTVTWWVMSAKQEATRKRRLATLMKESAKGRRIEFMRRAERSESGD